MHSFDGVSFTSRTPLGSAGYSTDAIVIVGNTAYLVCQSCAYIESYNLDTGEYNNTFAPFPVQPSTPKALLQFFHSIIILFFVTFSY